MWTDLQKAFEGMTRNVMGLEVWWVNIPCQGRNLMGLGTTCNLSNLAIFSTA